MDGILDPSEQPTTAPQRHQVTSDRRRFRHVAAIGATVVTVVVASPGRAGADVDPAQHPRSDPSLACQLLPVPGSSGDHLYPAGDDSFTVTAGQPAVLDVLDNDCANSDPSATRTWYTGVPVDAAASDAGDLSDPVGVVSDDSENGFTFRPNPGFTGTAKLSYQWFETGTENDAAYVGSYYNRPSTTAVVTLTVAPAATSTPTPTPTTTAPIASGSATAAPSATRPAPSRASSSPARPTAPASSAAAVPPSQQRPPAPMLANTGGHVERLLSWAASCLLAGAGAIAWGRRRRRALR